MKMFQSHEAEYMVSRKGGYVPVPLNSRPATLYVFERSKTAVLEKYKNGASYLCAPDKIEDHNTMIDCFWHLKNE